MKNFFSRPSGETLLEVMISLSVLMIVVGPAASLYIRSTQSTAQNRNYLIAEALVNEGIGFVRHIRDTNLIRFSSKADECWDTEPAYTVFADCEAHKIAEGSYTISLNPENLQLFLKKIGESFQLNAENPQVDYQLFKQASGPAFYFAKQASPDGATPEGIPYYREILIVPLNRNTAESEDDGLKVSARVLYQMPGRGYGMLKRETILTSHPDL